MPASTPQTTEATDAHRDEEALELRRSGASFARIARSLGYPRARDANAAFHRALLRREIPERLALRHDEFARLETLEQHVRDDAALTTATRDRRLHTIARMRDRLLAD